MKPKTFTALAAATAVAVLAAAVSLQRGDDGDFAAGAGAPVFPGLLARVNDVARVEIQYSDGAITIVDSQGGKDGWRVQESDGYPARTVKVKRSVLGLARLTLLEPKTRKKEKYAKLGLRDVDAEGAAAKRVRLLDAQGALLGDLLVGRRRANLAGTTSGGVYVRRPGDAQAWLAAGDTDITDAKANWLERKIIDVAGKRVKRIDVRHPDGEAYAITKAAPEGAGFTLENIPAGKKLISQGGPDAVGRALANLLLDDARRAPGPFDDAKAVISVFTTFDGLKVTTRVAKGADGKSWMRIAAEAAPEASGGDAKAAEQARAVTARTADWVYRITDYAASNLGKRLEFLIEDAKPPS